MVMCVVAAVIEKVLSIDILRTFDIYIYMIDSRYEASAFLTWSAAS